MLLELAVLLIAAFAATALIRRNAHRLGVVQSPNARSSHSVPTPSGGGVGIVLGGSIATAVAAIGAPVPYAAILVIALAVAAIGFYDDRRPIPARFRLPAQLVLAGIAIGLCVPLSALQQQIGLPLPELLLAGLALIAVVYWLNLFNFMDGIDGIAGAQAIFMCGAAALLIGPAGPAFWLLPLSYASSLSGWAWPAVIIAYLPLIGLALYFRAGAPETAAA
jgi:Fuc2NAc and GlcNAc transferase